MIKMLLFDLDDTLLNSEHKVDERTRKAIQRCAEKGILIGYITTRSPRTVLDLVSGLPVDAVSYFSGVKIYCENKLISQICIPAIKGQRLIKEYRKKNPEGYINAYFEPYSLKYESLYKNNSSCDETLEEALGEIDFQRIIFQTAEIPQLWEFITEDMKLTKVRNNNTVITHKNVCKGNAAGLIASYYNIDLQEVVAFGDDMNDFSMLRVCGIGVAMKNAIYEIKSVADYIIDSNNDEGIAKWIEKHIL